MSGTAPAAHRRSVATSRIGTSGARGYDVAIASDWTEHVPGWTGAPTPFQDPAWIETWYESLQGRAGLTPLLVTARDRATGALALHLPLVIDETGRRRIIAFADLGLTDYNAPLLGPAAPRDHAGAQALWRAIGPALPRADLLSLRKMPATFADGPNPLSLLRGACPCPLSGNEVRTGEDWEAYHRSLAKTVRKELERSWRVFSREPETAFRIVTDQDEAQRVLEVMARQQEARMRSLGADYRLDEAEFDAFYRRLVERGLGRGYAVVSALTSGDEVVAALLGIRDAGTYVMIRISNAGEGWSNCSPGRLVIDKTMEALHAEGCRSFDFSIGDYDYKRRFNVEPLPLVDLTVPLGWRGLKGAARARLVATLRRYPALDRRVRDLACRAVLLWRERRS
ncbi:GNAT family N-acetyltransferase [Methylobacterium sp. E-045]|uniref:GNAT family N-acetyltransferase n=1 Tax=Methylobacterium sp. E-045 TaxID=2836575 RepID=UPI001FBA5108|nr:GNAT family N-acetyltransferase [Methylobacterium sp. E-045]MCJ2131660.1 GNAT family N-acetyltransferase [Methylobacterium sp. E-045]